MPVLLARNGKVYEHVLRKQSLTGTDLDEAMREAGCTDRSRIAVAYLETDGAITVVPRAED